MFYVDVVLVFMRLLQTFADLAVVMGLAYFLLPSIQAICQLEA